MKKLGEFSGTGLSNSDSELVGKALFYCYYSIFYKAHDHGTKSTFDIMQKHSGIESSELVLNFLQAHAKFKKEGLRAFEK